MPISLPRVPSRAVTRRKKEDTTQMGQFDKIDLGNQKTMQRMVKAANESRNAVIEECALLLTSKHGWQQAAQAIRELKVEIEGE